MLAFRNRTRRSVLAVLAVTAWNAAAGSCPGPAQTAGDGDVPPRLRGGERTLAISGETGAGMFPKLLKLPGGEVIALVRNGARHIGTPGRIDLIRSRDGGRTWSRPERLPKTSEDDRGPAIGRAADGALVCMYRIYDAYDAEGKRRAPPAETVQRTMLTRSTDGGRTWSRPAEVKVPPYPFLAPFQRMVRLEDGTLLMTAYAPEAALVARSRDQGRTWGDVSVLGKEFNEWALLELPGGRLLAALRREKDGLWTRSSDDRGYTWSEPRRVTEGKRYPADLAILPSGRVLLVYGRRHPPYGVEARVSADRGATWGPATLVAWTASSTDCGYPSAVVLDDGTVLMLWYAVGSTQDPALGWHCEALRFREADLAARP